MLTWDAFKKDFSVFLRLEKSLSENSVDAYLEDVNKLSQWMEMRHPGLQPSAIELKHLENFLVWCNELGMGTRSQVRLISGIRAFFKFLLIENIIDKDPSHLLESPRIGRKLPDVLSLPEIDAILNCIDLSTHEGHRNHAIIETLYSCGLRVSEAIGLKISDLFFADGYIKVKGKGSKERLVPISDKAIHEIKLYLEHFRNQIKITKKSEDILFLNRRGAKLSRVMIFILVKDLATKARVNKNISPHTFRHSFASHLVEGGADLRSVQEMLGHESIITTEIYTHLDREFLRDAIIRFHPRSQKK